MEQMAKFYEIFDYYYTPFSQTIYFKLAIAGGIVLIAGIIALIIWFKKFKKPEPWEWADQELNKIDINSYQTKEEFKTFYFTITGIIKQYLEKRHGWDTQDKTDEELVKYLKARSFAAGPLASLEKMLAGALWIKFANENIIKSQAEIDLQIAKNIIEKTKPKEPIAKF